MPTATATADPTLDPPAIRPASQGLSAAPKWSFAGDARGELLRRELAEQDGTGVVESGPAGRVPVGDAVDEHR